MMKEVLLISVAAGFIVAGLGAYINAPIGWYVGAAVGVVVSGIGMYLIEKNS
jgi:hypothetical protein